MEIESLDLANRETNDAVRRLEDEIKRYTTPSIHSIHSEDLAYLSRIRELAKEELKLKRCINDLTKKETLFCEQIDRLLTAKEFQAPCGAQSSTKCGRILSDESKLKDSVKRSVCVGGDSRRDKVQPRTCETKPSEAPENTSSWILNWWKGKKNTSPVCKVEGDEKSSCCLRKKYVRYILIA